MKFRNPKKYGRWNLGVGWSIGAQVSQCGWDVLSAHLWKLPLQTEPGPGSVTFVYDDNTFQGSLKDTCQETGEVISSSTRPTMEETTVIFSKTPSGIMTRSFPSAG